VMTASHQTENATSVHAVAHSMHPLARS
jgi:hypothetical protein